MPAMQWETHVCADWPPWEANAVQWFLLCAYHRQCKHLEYMGPQFKETEMFADFWFVLKKET